MATTYLSRTLGTPTNNKKWTFSAWVKKGHIGGDINTLFSAGGDSSNYFQIWTNYNNGQIQYYSQLSGGSAGGSMRLSNRLRDISGWYNIVVSFDSANSTASERLKIYINGIQQLDTSSGGDLTYPTQNTSSLINSAIEHTIGKDSYRNASYLEGSVSHLHFIDGTVYDASAFGSTDSTTGEWQINTSPSVTYGTNGFFILKDGNTITDSSTNSNNFSLGGGTLTKTEDCPSNVFCVLNALSTVSGMTLAKGNTTCQSDSTWRSTMGTLGMSAGKYYWEAKVLSLGTINFGITMSKQDGTTHSSVDATRIMYSSNGTVYRDALGDSVSSLATFGVNDIIGISLDCDNGILKFYKNDSLIHTTTNSVITNNEWMPANGVNNAHGAMNFGNGYFNTTAVSSAGTNASGNGIFEYDVPTGYTALSTKGLNL